MRFTVYGHRYGDFIFKNWPLHAGLYDEVLDVLASITDEDVIREFEKNKRAAKSISQAINTLIKDRLVKKGWESESYIFAEPEYAEMAQHSGVWRLDFAKDRLCIEVAFNHRSDISWNLIKPTLASELNHVMKAVQCDGGIIITATKEMKVAGGFDNAVGTYEDYVEYLKPLGQILTAPLMIVGLLAPESFRIETVSHDRRKVGHVVRL